jgi:hypothetical protein
MDQSAPQSIVLSHDSRAELVDDDLYATRANAPAVSLTLAG